MNDRSAMFRRLAVCALGAALAPLAWAQGATPASPAATPAGFATTSAVERLVNLPPPASAVPAPRATPNPTPFDVTAAELRWRSSLQAFAEQDRLARPLPGGVLFVGSSSIRLWDKLEEVAPQI